MEQRTYIFKNIFPSIYQNLIKNDATKSIFLIFCNIVVFLFDKLRVCSRRVLAKNILSLFFLYPRTNSYNFFLLHNIKVTFIKHTFFKSLLVNCWAIKTFPSCPLGLYSKHYDEIIIFVLDAFLKLFSSPFLPRQRLKY